jgi:hypothetical protein
MGETGERGKEQARCGGEVWRRGVDARCGNEVWRGYVLYIICIYTYICCCVCVCVCGAGMP